MILLLGISNDELLVGSIQPLPGLRLDAFNHMRNAFLEGVLAVDIELLQR